MSTIGFRISTERKASKLTQPELAKLIGVSKATISFWENDVNSPKGGGSLLELSRVLGVSAMYLNSGIDDAMASETQSIFDDFLKNSAPQQLAAVVALMQSLTLNQKK